MHLIKQIPRKRVEVKSFTAFSTVVCFFGKWRLLRHQKLKGRWMQMVLPVASEESKRIYKDVHPF